MHVGSIPGLLCKICGCEAPRDQPNNELSKILICGGAVTLNPNESIAEDMCFFLEIQINACPLGDFGTMCRA